MPSPGPFVDILSFNIRHAEGTDGVLDLDRIARVIGGSGAEVVGLQEVDRHFGDRSGWADQATELAAALGYHLAYGVNLDLGPSGREGRRVQYGTAVLSRHPIVRSENVHLFRSPDEEQRGLLHAEIDLPLARLHIFVTHLEFFSEIDRTAQAREVVQRIGNRRLAVLVGDFNATPDTAEIATVRAAFSDSWLLFGGEAPPTFPADEPKECIDYIFAGPGLTPVNVGPVTDDPAASDHLPVLARLELTRPAVVTGFSPMIK